MPYMSNDQRWKAVAVVGSDNDLSPHSLTKCPRAGLKVQLVMRHELMFTAMDYFCYCEIIIISVNQIPILLFLA